MTADYKRLPGNTIELHITFPWSEIKTVYDRIFALVLAEVELPGFRKGKAPKELAVKQVNPTKIYEEVLKEMVPYAYAQAVKQHNLQPIISPKVEVLEASENKDWKLKVSTCEKPHISLGNYKQAVTKIKQSKKTKIWTPGSPKEEPNKDELTLGEVLDAIASEIKVELSELILEQEVNRLLSNLINETQKLGLTVEQYLQSQGKTNEQLRRDYKSQAQKTLSLEFALEEIAEVEKITVEPSEIESVIANAKDPQEKKTLESERYYIGSLLRRQKALASLMQSEITTIDTAK